VGTKNDSNNMTDKDAILVVGDTRVASESVQTKDNLPLSDNPAEQQPHITNLVFEGGGVLGFAYVGVVQALEERSILHRCTSFAGTSAGAIAAGLLACRASPRRLQEALESLDFAKLVDYSYVPFSNSFRLWRHGGIARGERLEEWFADILGELCDGRRNITLSEVQERFGTRVVATGTCLETQGPIYYTPETHGDMSLARVVRISSGYPCLFPMIEDTVGEHVWDGGIADNYPIHVFDTADTDTDGVVVPIDRLCAQRVPNAATIGFKLHDRSERLAPAERSRKTIGNVYDALSSLASMLLQMSRRVHERDIDWQRSVLIDVGNFGALDFDMSDSDKALLVTNGRSATLAHLDKMRAPAAKLASATTTVNQ